MNSNHGGSRPNSGPSKSEPTTKMVSVRFPIAALKKIDKDRGTESLIKYLLRNDQKVKDLRFSLQEALEDFHNINPDMEHEDLPGWVINAEQCMEETS